MEVEKENKSTIRERMIISIITGVENKWMRREENNHVHEKKWKNIGHEIDKWHTITTILKNCNNKSHYSSIF